MASVVVRHRRAVGAERDRTRWLLWSVEAGGVATRALAAHRRHASSATSCSSWWPCCRPWRSPIGIVRPTLVPVQDLINGTLVFALLSLSLVVVDLLVVAGLSAVLDDSLDERQVVVVVLLLTVMLYGPLRQRLSAHRAAAGARPARGAVRRRGRARVDPRALRRGRRAAGRRDRRGGGGLRDRVRAAWRSTGPAANGWLRPTASDPAEVRTLPITYREQEVGRRGAAAAWAAQPVDPPRRAAARRPGPPGGVRRPHRPAGRGAPGEPRAAGRRPRGGAAADPPRPPRRAGAVAERRRLPARVGPAAGRQGPGRPPSGSIGGISEHVQDVVADVRRLVHDLRPPALDDRGLVGALRQQAEQVSAPAPRGDGRRRRPRARCPAAVEVAAYRIAGEALTNVARHAGASTGAPSGSLVDERRAAGRGRRRRRRHRPRPPGRCRPGRLCASGPPSSAAAARSPARPRAAPSCAPGCPLTRGGKADERDPCRRRRRPRRSSATASSRCSARSTAIEVVGSAADGREALHVVAETEPDVVVMDIQMPQLDGIEATRFLIGRHPGSGS